MNRVILVVALISLGAPSALAGWGAKGSYEPDTARDQTDGWMFEETDTTPTDASPRSRMVYFNGFYGQCTFPCYLPASSFNANFATLGSANVGTLRYTYAMLGVWKDCNNDGYVGLGDQGLFEYRAEILAATYGASICKPETTPVGNIQTGLPPLDWFPSHNDGQWVREFLPIQWSRWDAAMPNGRDQNPWNVNDNASRVWVDGALPETDRSGGGGCWINPQPRGTYHNVGGLVEYADCHNRYRATDGLTTLDQAFGIDSLGAGQLTFDDKPRDQSESGSILNVKPWGEQSDGSYVQPWNCGAAQTHIFTPAQDLDTPAGKQYIAQQNVTNISQPNAPPGTSTSGSLSGTMNATGSGFDQCNRRDHTGGGTGGTTARLPYANEADVVNVQHKIGTTVLGPAEDLRPAAPFAAALGKAVPPDMGAKVVGRDGLWLGGAITSGTPLADPATGNIAGVHHITYYASVSSGAISAYGLSLPKGSATGTYAFEACGTDIGPGSPDKLGWACDTSLWWKDPSTGADLTPRSTYLAPSPGVSVAIVPGDSYNVRDIDCYDMSTRALREQGIGWGVVGSYPGCAYST